MWKIQATILGKRLCEIHGFKVGEVVSDPRAHNLEGWVEMKGGNNYLVYKANV